jgi:uncharacterized protein YkwD
MIKQLLPFFISVALSSCGLGLPGIHKPSSSHPSDPGKNQQSGGSASQTPSEIEKSQVANCYKAEADICAVEKKLLELTNQYRRVNGNFKPVALGPKLSFAARQWSKTQAERHIIGHDAFPGDRLILMKNEFGESKNYSVVDEGVATFSQYSKVLGPLDGEFALMWHGTRAQYIIGDYPMVGIGVAKNPNGTYYATQIFGEE